MEDTKSRGEATRTGYYHCLNPGWDGFFSFVVNYIHVPRSNPLPECTYHLVLQMDENPSNANTSQIFVSNAKQLKNYKIEFGKQNFTFKMKGMHKFSISLINNNRDLIASTRIGILDLGTLWYTCKESGYTTLKRSKTSLPSEGNQKIRLYMKVCRIPEESITVV